MRFARAATGFVAGWMGIFSLFMWARIFASQRLARDAARWRAVADARGLLGSDLDPGSTRGELSDRIFKMAQAALSLSGAPVDCYDTLEFALWWRMDRPGAFNLEQERAAREPRVAAFVMRWALGAASLGWRDSVAGRPSAGDALSRVQAEGLWRSWFPSDAAAWERAEIEKAARDGGARRAPVRI